MKRLIFSQNDIDIYNQTPLSIFLVAKRRIKKIAPNLRWNRFGTIKNTIFIYLNTAFIFLEEKMSKTIKNYIYIGRRPLLFALHCMWNFYQMAQIFGKHINESAIYLPYCNSWGKAILGFSISFMELTPWFQLIWILVVCSWWTQLFRLL